MHLIAQLLPGFAYNCPTVTTQFVNDIRLRYYLIPLQFILNNIYCDNVAHTFFKTALSVVRRVACSMLLQIACHWITIKIYQSVMTVETVGLFKTAERNPEKRLECGNKTGSLSDDNSGT